MNNTRTVSIRAALILSVVTGAICIASTVAILRDFPGAPPELKTGIAICEQYTDAGNRGLPPVVVGYLIDSAWTEDGSLILWMRTSGGNTPGYNAMPRSEAPEPDPPAHAPK